MTLRTGVSMTSIRLFEFWTRLPSVGTATAYIWPVIGSESPKHVGRCTYDSQSEYIPPYSCVTRIDSRIAGCFRRGAFAEMQYVPLFIRSRHDDRCGDGPLYI